MAIDAFAWKIQASGQPAVTVKDNIRKVQFGDGYTQVSGNGLNSETLNYAFSYTGNKDTALEIYAFLRSHKTKSFSFQPPYEELALWRVQADSLQLIIKSKKLITITAIFEQAFAP